jgi:hypothetical protein
MFMDTAMQTQASLTAGSPLVAASSSKLTAQSCPACGTSPAPAQVSTPPAWVYALGRVEPRFPSVSVEKEFAQATGREKTAGLTDRQAQHAILSKPDNRYLARQLCWVLTIEGLETYILQPRDSADITLLIETLRPNPSPLDLDVVIGQRGGIAGPEMCNGLLVPIVVFDQIYSSDREELVKAIPKPEKQPAKEFAAASDEVLDRIMLMADNAGATDAHRALNYLALRYPAIYSTTANAFAANQSLSAVDVRPSNLSGVRNIVDVVFSYLNRSTDVVEKFACRVDVTDEFPFLVTKIAPHYDR